MDRPPVSIVVPSLGRPRELDRCLTALRQLRYRPIEIVVVACEAGRAAAARHERLPWLHVIPNRETGLCVARNDGIAAAGGDIVAFIDDDAVPEPTWLDHLVQGMEATGAAAATGFVRGRNGISFQWRGRAIRRDGFIDRLTDAGEAPYVPTPSAGIPMLEGTNMAFRRDVLARMNGFDPAFRFYMDDADMALRLSAAGHRVAVVPLAQVHHGFAASSRRRADRMPTDLYDIGRSLAFFLRAHLGKAEMPPVLAAHREGERRRLLRYMVSGHGEPRDVGRCLAQFDAGAADGLRVQARSPAELGPAPEGACFRNDPAGGSRVLAGSMRSRRTLRRAGAEAAGRGETASLFVFTPTTLYHRVRFDPAGYWEQTGGLFGRAERTEPLVQPRSFADRLRQEIARVAKTRGLLESHA
jgi:GT2 family glycosyltransferase